MPEMRALCSDLPSVEQKLAPVLEGLLSLGFSLSY